MSNVNVLRVLEGLNLTGQVEMLVDMLEQNGFSHTKVKSRKKTVNDFYYSEDSDIVLCVISHKNDDFCSYVLLDKDLYMTEFQGIKRLISFNERNDKKMKVLVHGQGYSNKVLHRLAMHTTDRQVQVDHISHNTHINIKEYLRPCIAQENMFNQRFYSTVNIENFSFSAPDKVINIDDRLSLARAGFEFYKHRVYSPSYKSLSEVYEAVGEFEDKFLKEFRYNPFKDFSETWYVLVLWKMLHLIDETEVVDYQRDYFKRTDSKLAKYYCL